MLVFLSAMCMLVTPLWFLYKPPEFLLRYLQRRWPDVLWHVSTSSKIVALTIDDAPSEYTNEMMQILKENNANATFFVIGSQAVGHEETLKDLVKSGNELGNHGTSFQGHTPHFSLGFQFVSRLTAIHTKYIPYDSHFRPTR